MLHILAKLAEKRGTCSILDFSARAGNLEVPGVASMQILYGHAQNGTKFGPENRNAPFPSKIGWYLPCSKAEVPGMASILITYGHA